MSSVVYVNAGSSFPTGYNTKCLRSRIGKVQANTEKNYTNAPWGSPFVTNGDARGLEIRNEIVKTTKNYSGDKNTTNMQYIIKHYLGDKMYETVAQDPDNYYLILEACAYHSAYNGAGQKVGDVLASAYGWAYLNKINGLPKTGDGRNGWCDQYRLQRSCYLNKNWTGLPKVPTNFAGSTWNSGADGISTDYLLGNYGYGMIAIRATEGGIELTTRLGAQSTCQEEHITTAHSPWYETPDDGKINGIKTKVTYDKNGIAKKIESVPTTYKIETDRNIVKTYLTKIQYVDKKGNVVKDEEGNEIVEYKIDSAYKIRQNCMPYIRIEDETKEAALENYRIASMTDPISIDFVHDIIEIGYSEKDYEKMRNKIESKKEEDCYSIDRWYVTNGKVLKSSTVEDGILTSDNSNIRLKSLLTENGKTITCGGKHQAYVDLRECTDTKGKPSKNVYIVLTKTVQKPYYQSTCDEDHVEKNDNNLSKLPHAAPDESNSGNCTIVKTYITKTVSKDTNGVEIGATYKVDATYDVDKGDLVKTNSISKIDIENEVVNGKGVYKLAKYIVTSGKVIPNDKFHPITSNGSDTQFEYNIGTQNGKNIVCRGDTPGTITLDKHSKNGEKGKILYVYLMREIELVNTTKNESKASEHKAPEESEGKCAIVKCYREIDADTGEITGVATYTTKDVANAIWIENEDTPTGKVVKNNVVETVNNSKQSGYHVVSYKSTDTILNLSSLGMSGAEFAGMEDWYNKVPGKRLEGVDGAIIDNDGKKIHIKPGACLYILLEKEINGITGDFTIKQSSLTKRVHLSDSSATANIVTHNFRWTAPAISKTSCSGHKWWCGGCVCHGHPSYYYGTYYCGGCSCPSHTDYCSGWQWVDDSITLQLDNTKKNSYPDIIIGTNKMNWQTITNYRGLSLRRDYLTRYSTGSDTKTLNNYDYAMVLWRGKDKLTVAEWKNSSSVNSLMKQIGFFVGNTPKGTRQTSEYLESFQTLFSCVSPDRNTRYTATISAPNSGGLCSVPTSTYQFNVGTQLKQSATVDVETYSGKDGGGENNKLTTGNGLIEAGTITFYPYIKMKYDKYDTTYTTNTSQTAYVLGQYKRKITFYDLAEVMFKEDKTGNIQVDSNQWSTHKQINDKLETVLDADTTSLDNHMILPGGTTYWVSNIAYKSDGSIDKKTHQVVTIRTFQTYLASEGKTQITKTNGSSTLKSKTDAVNANKEFVESVEKAFKKLRLVQWVNTNPKKDPFKGQIVYSGDTFGGNTLSSDKKYYFNEGKDAYLDTHIDASKTSQKEYTFKADAEGNILMNGSVILRLGELASDIDDPTAKLINNKTGIVSQLREGLEDNVGMDKTAKWASSSGKWYNEAFDGVTVLVTTTTMNVGLWDPTERQTVSDPALTPVQGDKSEIGSQFWVTQMKTRQYSDLYGESNPNQVGVFKGLKIYVNDLSKFMISKKWYIPNVTSQDLK